MGKIRIMLGISGREVKTDYAGTEEETGGLKSRSRREQMGCSTKGKGSFRTRTVPRYQGGSQRISRHRQQGVSGNNTFMFSSDCFYFLSEIRRKQLRMRNRNEE